MQTYNGIYFGSYFGSYFGQNIPLPQNIVGGALSWYHGSWSKDKKKKADNLVNKIEETLEAIAVPEEIIKKQDFIPQKEIIIDNIVKNLSLEDYFNHSEIQSAIFEAELRYYQNLARLRELDDEAAILLLIN
jgi:hypothetical protein